MKKYIFLILTASLFFTQAIFAQKQPAPDIMVTVSETEEEKLEEFDFPDEMVLAKNVIKADIGSPFSAGLFELFDLIPADIVRFPLEWEIAFSKHVAFQLEIESLSYLIVPAAAGVTGGFSIYPLGKAPYDLFISIRGGGAFGLLYALTAQAQIGWQFILKNNFVISLGADFSYYYGLGSDQFYIPSVNFALGWAF
ncbi:MAG: hypothetical protein K6G52_06385 [Treponemataceae bacterium]|nr:hypothetical protein [Treponemataceae bacterium]